MSASSTRPRMPCHMMARRPAPTMDGRPEMPRKLPPHVERNQVKGHTYLSFRIGKGARIRLPSDPTSEEFRQAYAAAMSGDTSSSLAGVEKGRSWQHRRADCQLHAQRPVHRAAEHQQGGLYDTAGDDAR